MKYIRTKDGIYTDKRYELKNIVEKNGECFISIEETQIIKQADTIEELCDEFVLENEITAESQCSLMKLKEFEALRKAICEASKITHKNCFGAIWTDKGLIYVAKMNDKGALELL